MGKFPGAICKSQDRKYLAVYNFQHDVYSLPSAYMQGLERVAHASYSRGGKKGGVDYFLLTEERNLAELIRVNKTIEKQNEGISISFTEESKNKRDNFKFFQNDQLTRTDEKYDIQYELINLPESIKQDIFGFARADIRAFCREKSAKEPRGTKKEIVEKILAKTKMEKINPWKYLTGGKQWFIPECILEANIDFGQGCISGFVPIDDSWKFDGEYFYNLFSMPSGECEYCYAERQHRSFPKTIYKFDKKQLKEELLGGAKLSFENPEEILGKPVKILRFGKRTESWTPFTQDEFVETLETCIDTGTHGIIPTKFLPYSPEVADLLKKTNSTLLYSIGFEDVEAGALAWGADNQFRLEQAWKYKEAGVNSNVYLLTIGHHPPSQREMKVLEFTDFGEKIPIQILPLRFQGKGLVKKMTSDDFDILISKQENLFEKQPYRGSYVKERHSILLKTFDLFWLNLAKNSNGNVRICHHNDTKVYCGRCFQGKDAQSQIRKKD